jgi:single-stranded DNA-binding protein
MFELSIVCGHLTADAATTPCKNSRVMIACRIASDRYDHTQGKEVAEFHSVKYFADERYAASLSKRMKKGALVFAVGERATEEWEDNDGNTRRTQRIVADHLKVVVDAKPAQAEPAPEPEHQPTMAAPSPAFAPPPPRPSPAQFAAPEPRTEPKSAAPVVGDTRDHFRGVSFK